MYCIIMQTIIYIYILLIILCMNNVYSTDCVRDLYLPVSVTTIRHFIKWPSVCNYPCHGHALLRIICMSVFFATRSKTKKRDKQQKNPPNRE